MTYRDLRRRYLADASLSALATAEGVSPNSIARKLRLMGVTVRDRRGSRRRLAACLPQVFDLYYDRGLTAAQVGVALGVSEPSPCSEHSGRVALASGGPARQRRPGVAETQTGTRNRPVPLSVASCLGTLRCQPHRGLIPTAPSST